MSKSSLFLFASIAIVTPVFAAKKSPLLNEKECSARIDTKLQKIYENSKYGYKGGGYIESVKYIGEAHSLINFMAPGWGSDSVEEVVVANKDCEVLSNSQIWTD